MNNNKFWFSTEGMVVFLSREEKGQTEPGSNSLIYFFFSVLEYVTSEYESNMIPKLKG